MWWRALQDEWDGLRANKGGTWLEDLVEEYDDVVRRARLHEVCDRQRADHEQRVVAA